MISELLAVIAVTLLFSGSVYASYEYQSKTYYLSALGVNSLMLSPTKQTSNTTFDKFKWESGTANSFKMFIKSSDNSTWIADKTTFSTSYRGDGKFHRINYRAGVTITNGSAYNVYGEQSNVSQKTVKGIFVSM